LLVINNTSLPINKNKKRIVSITKADHRWSRKERFAAQFHSHAIKFAQLSNLELGSFHFAARGEPTHVIECKLVRAFI